MPHCVTLEVSCHFLVKIGQKCYNNTSTNNDTGICIIHIYHHPYKHALDQYPNGPASKSLREGIIYHA